MDSSLCKQAQQEVPFNKSIEDYFDAEILFHDPRENKPPFNGKMPSYGAHAV